MGVKGWLFIGAGVVLTIVAALGLRKREDLCAEKTEYIIKEVDEKARKNKEVQPVDAVEKLANDVEEAFKDMGLDDAEIVAEAVEIKEK